MISTSATIHVSKYSGKKNLSATHTHISILLLRALEI